MTSHPTPHRNPQIRWDLTGFEGHAWGAASPTRATGLPTQRWQQKRLDLVILVTNRRQTGVRATDTGRPPEQHPKSTQYHRHHNRGRPHANNLHSALGAAPQAATLQAAASGCSPTERINHPESIIQSRTRPNPSPSSLLYPQLLSLSPWP